MGEHSAESDAMQAIADATTPAPWRAVPMPRRVDVRGLAENTSYDYRGDAVATTGDSDFGAMPEADAAFVVMARNNWDRLMAAWQFTVEYARTSGDSPVCDCVPCLAARAIEPRTSSASSDAGWSPVATTVACDWCGECEWCDQLGRPTPPVKGGDPR